MACQRDFTVTINPGAKNCALSAFTKQLADIPHILPAWVKTTSRLWLSDSNDAATIVGVFNFLGAPFLERTIPSPSPNDYECDGIFQEPITGKVLLALNNFNSNIESIGFCASGSSTTVTTQVQLPLTTSYAGSFSQFFAIPSAAHPTVCLFRRLTNGSTPTEPNVLLIRVDNETFGNQAAATTTDTGNIASCFCPTTNQILVPSGYEQDAFGNYIITCFNATTLGVVNTFSYLNAADFKPQSLVYVSSTNKIWTMAAIGFLQTTLAVLNVTTGAIEDQFLINGGNVGREITYDAKCDKILLSTNTDVQVYNAQTHAFERSVNNGQSFFSFIAVDEVLGDAYTVSTDHILQIGS